MVVADPAAELLDLARRAHPPRAVEVRAATLLRRRFGLALPPPFAAAPAAGAPIPPVRPAAPTDAAAIAAVKWRTFGTSYRGVLPDAFLDRREVVPPVSFWVRRAAAPRSTTGPLLVWGRPGEVLGYVDAGPSRDDDVDQLHGGEVYELYVDASAQGRGGGAALLAQAVAGIRQAGRSDVRLWVLAANRRAQAFYAAQGWSPDGGARREDLGVAVLDEVRFRLGAPSGTWPAPGRP